jgi:hypothetical protein
MSCDLRRIRKLHSTMHFHPRHNAGGLQPSSQQTCKSRCISNQMKQHIYYPPEPSIHNLHIYILDQWWHAVFLLYTVMRIKTTYQGVYHNTFSYHQHVPHLNLWTMIPMKHLHLHIYAAHSWHCNIKLLTIYRRRPHKVHGIVSTQFN